MGHSFAPCGNGTRTQVHEQAMDGGVNLVIVGLRLRGRFLAPIDDDAVNVLKAGQGVPVELSLGDRQGMAATCRELIVTLSDGTSHKAQFKFKRWRWSHRRAGRDRYSPPRRRMRPPRLVRSLAHRCPDARRCPGSTA